MELLDYVDSIKDQLTGFGVLESELSDDAYKRIVNTAVKELNRYYNDTEVIEVPGESCIDLNKYPTISNVINVYRSTGVGLAGTTDSERDPVMMSQLQMFNFGNKNFANDWSYRYSIYSTAQRISNTMSTDLMFKEDKIGHKLYVNLPQGLPETIVIEFVPILRDASEVKGEYWQDVLLRLALAHAKIALGRARTRFTQSGAIWSSDGDTILAEGKEELAAIRDKLSSSVDLFMPLD